MNKPPEPHTPSWCELNPKRCKDNVLSVSIESYLLTVVLIIAGILLVLHALKIINMRTIFKKYQHSYGAKNRFVGDN